MDSENIPEFDRQQFEGNIEKPIGKKSFLLVSVFFSAAAVFFLAKVFYLQVARGQEFFERSENNSLRQEILLAPRGIIYDRNGEKLAWNGLKSREYAQLDGLSHVLGYVGFPSEADLESGAGISFKSMIGKGGIEKKYEFFLRGTHGVKLVEADSQNNIVSESVQDHPSSGEKLVLAIDSKVQSRFFQIIDLVAKERGFSGGAGVILDVNNGEVITLVSWPEYDSQVLSSGEPADEINKFLLDENKPFLNRAISGLYAPGSIIKPCFAIAALNEKIVSPDKRIYSAGSISIPNPFFPDKRSVFKDWKAHGWVDMRRALAVSSDVYFYEIGGGFEDLLGLGIKRIGEYAKKFGFDSKTGIDLDGEASGIVANPELKAKSNPSDPMWRIGDTYNASIGQGYFLMTPIEAAVFASALANGGKLVQPRLTMDKNLVSGEQIKDFSEEIPEEYFQIAREGMRMAVTEGTAMALSTPDVAIAAKTGTAEIGGAKKYVNSWVIGFFPYQNPKYAFALVMERGPAANLVGASSVMRQLVDWMSIYTPEYLR